MKPINRVDSVVFLLTGLVLSFVGVLIWVAVNLKSDGQTFQIISGLVTGFSGALLMRINPTKTPALDTSDASVKKTVDTHVETTSPKDSSKDQ